MNETPPAEQTKAVALGYNREADEAPKVLATGRGAIANQIIDLAFAHGVRVREDKPLVEILELIDVDSPIPLEAFTAVAEILTYVYRANSLYGKPHPSAQTANVDREAHDGFIS